MRNRALTPRRVALIASLTCAVVAAPAAHAFADDDARNAILQLRQQLDQSQQQQVQLYNQIQSLQDRVDKLSGEVEELQHSQQRQQQQQQQPGAGNDQQGDNTSGQPGPLADPQEANTYNSAIDLFRKGQYKKAADSLSAFVALYPNSQMAPAARFFQGSSRYALKDYKGAISTLEGVVHDYPNDPHAADAMLVIAGCQIEMNNRSAAKATMQKLISQYPNTQAATSAKSRLKLLQ
jgi:tol-pal system protein YbgF